MNHHTKPDHDAGSQPGCAECALVELAAEAVAIQQGSLDDALCLVEDFPEGDERDRLIQYVCEIAEAQGVSA